MLDRKELQTITQALRCSASPGSKCSEGKCPYYKMEDLPDYLTREYGGVHWASCDVDAIAIDAADVLEAVLDRMPASESRVMFADEVEALEDRKQFVRNLGGLLAQTREGVLMAELDDEEVVTVYFRHGDPMRVNVRLDSYMAIIRDVAGRI